MIYIRDAKRKKNEKFDNFFKRVFLDKTYLTRTFKDKKCNIFQCNAATYRSFEDIMEIARTYYHNISEEKVAKCVSTRDRCTFLYCPHIHKWVLTNSFSNCGIKYLYDYRYCKNFTNKIGSNGKYSFDMIVALINK